MTHKIFIYELDPIENSSKGKLKGAGYSYNTDYQDGELYIDGKTNIQEIMDNIYVKMYKSRMTTEYISTTKKLSFMYASIYYQKKFVTGHLLNITVYFDIISDTKTFTSFSELLNAELDGKYFIEIEIGDKKKIIDIDKIGNIEDIKNQIMMIIKSDAMSKIIMSEMDKRDKERVEKYGKMLSDVPKKPKYKFDDLLKIYEEDGNMDRINKIIQ